MPLLPPILVADDDDTDIFFLERAFNAAELRNPLWRARDGQEAIELLEKCLASNQRLPVLLLIDLRMPRRDGMDLLGWVKEQAGTRCLPVIVHSTSDHPAESERAYNLGANLYVVKPASSSERLDFAHFLKKWLHFARPPLAAVEGPVAAQTFRCPR